MKRERDMHRMHHQRVVQEKNGLVKDIKRLKNHVDSYEPALNELKRKYDVAMKEKMMARLDRDKMAAKVTSLEQELLAATSDKPAEMENQATSVSAHCMKWWWCLF